MHLKPLLNVPSYYFGRCLLLNDFKTDCVANNLIKMIIGYPLLNKYPIDCSIFTKRYPYFKDICEFHLKTVPLRKVNETNTNLIFPNQIESNHIYMGKESDVFEKLPSEKDNEMIYPRVPGWTWNSQIADYDNDGLQDIFIVNGSLVNEQNGPNYFLKNERNKFLVKTFEYNLNDIFNYYSFTPIDFDNDGGLDIITNSSEGPVRVYKNDHGGKNILASDFNLKMELRILFLLKSF